MRPPSRPHRIFLLSPASCSGERARILLREEASFDLARRLRREGAPIGEVFSFLSGLYFRGKLTYARAFARAPRGVDPILVITSDGGPTNTNPASAHAAANAGLCDRKP